MGRSRSRSRERHKHKSRKHQESRDHKRSKHHRSRSRSPSYPRKGRDVVQKVEAPQPIVKQLPCWEPSGILLEYYNAREGVALKFHEPPDGKIPIDKWRIYPFKGETALNPILLKGQSCYLIGKDQRICDILLEDPTVSRQHGVIQFREKKNLTLDGYTEQILPYLMDLDSSNGTFLNGEKIQGSRYVQLLPQDKITFGSGNEEFLMIKQ